MTRHFGIRAISYHPARQRKINTALVEVGDSPRRDLPSDGLISEVRSHIFTISLKV